MSIMKSQSTHALLHVEIAGFLYCHVRIVNQFCALVILPTPLQNAGCESLERSWVPWRKASSVAYKPLLHLGKLQTEAKCSFGQIESEEINSL